MVTKSEIKKIMEEIDIILLRLYGLEKGNASFEIDYSMAELECAKDWLTDAIDVMEGKAE